MLAVFIAGMVGGVAMVAARLALRVAGVPLAMDLTLVWGSMLGLLSWPGRLTGFVVHVVGSGVIGWFYLLFLLVLDIDSRLLWWALAGGAVHWLLAGLSLGLLPHIHPRMPTPVPAPGTFARAMGRADTAMFVAGHLLYGVVTLVVFGLLTGPRNLGRFL